MTARHHTLVFLVLIFTLVISSCGPGKAGGPTPYPSRTRSNTPTVTLPPTATPTRDPSIPFGLILRPLGYSYEGNLDNFDAYNAAVPQAWKVVEGGIPRYYVRVEDEIGMELEDCRYESTTAIYDKYRSFQRKQHNLTLSLIDYASDQEITFLTVAAPLPSTDPCPYYYDESIDTSIYNTQVDVESFVTGLFELLQPVQADLPPATVEQALVQAANPSPTQTPAPVDTAGILDRVCDPQSGNCGMFVAVDTTQAGWLEWVNATIAEYYQISPAQYTLLEQEIQHSFLTTTAYEGCELLESAGQCLDRTLRPLRISPCFLVPHWYLGTFTQPESYCKSMYLLLPAAGAQSGQSVFDPSDLKIITSVVVNIPRENMQAALEEVFPR